MRNIETPTLGRATETTSKPPPLIIRAVLYSCLEIRSRSVPTGQKKEKMAGLADTDRVFGGMKKRPVHA